MSRLNDLKEIKKIQHDGPKRRNALKRQQWLTKPESEEMLKEGRTVLGNL